jgi:hypothetical protein
VGTPQKKGWNAVLQLISGIHIVDWRSNSNERTKKVSKSCDVGITVKWWGRRGKREMDATPWKFNTRHKTMWSVLKSRKFVFMLMVRLPFHQLLRQNSYPSSIIWEASLRRSVNEVNAGEGNVGKKWVNVDLRLIRFTGKCGSLMTGVF